MIHFLPAAPAASAATGGGTAEPVPAGFASLLAAMTGAASGAGAPTTPIPAAGAATGPSPLAASATTPDTGGDAEDTNPPAALSRHLAAVPTVDGTGEGSAGSPVSADTELMPESTRPLDEAPASDATALTETADLDDRHPSADAAQGADRPNMPTTTPGRPGDLPPPVVGDAARGLGRPESPPPGRDASSAERAAGRATAPATGAQRAVLPVADERRSADAPGAGPTEVEGLVAAMTRAADHAAFLRDTHPSGAAPSGRPHTAMAVAADTGAEAPVTPPTDTTASLPTTDAPEPSLPGLVAPAPAAVVAATTLPDATGTPAAQVPEPVSDTSTRIVTVSRDPQLTDPAAATPSDVVTDAPAAPLDGDAISTDASETPVAAPIARPTTSMESDIGRTVVEPVAAPAAASGLARASATVPSDTPASSTLSRVLEAVEQLENAPPPRTMGIELAEEGLRLQIELRGRDVIVTVHGDDELPGLARDLQGALDQRGFGLGDLRRERRDHQTPEGRRPTDPDPDRQPPPRRDRQRDDALRM